MERSAEQADELVMLAAKADITFPQLVTFAAQALSRTCVILVTDFSAWKNDMEFYFLLVLSRLENITSNIPGVEARLGGTL